ncbi:MAG: glycosyltransferase, partial [bacterium]
RLTPAKGHQILFNAVARLLRNRDDFLVHVVGDGELKTELMAVAQSFNLNGHLRFLGFRDDVRTLYPTFDMVVIPSLWEGLSLTLLEAMASGLPVVATAVSGNIDAIENGRNGLLIPPNSARELAKGIEYILDHPENAVSLGRRARQVVVDKFSVQTMVKQYERLYSDVIKTEV